MPLLDLPELALTIITRAVGPAARLVCTRLRDTYGCPALGLDLPPTTSAPADTLAAWQWLDQLRHLRLRLPIAPDHAPPLLATIAARVPHLRTLEWHHDIVTPGHSGDAASSAVALTTLTALAWLEPSPSALMMLPQLAPRLRHLALNLSPMFWAHLEGAALQTPFSSAMQQLPRITALQLMLQDAPDSDAAAWDLALGLRQLAPSLACLQLYYCTSYENSRKSARCRDMLHTNMRELGVCGSGLPGLTSLAANNCRALHVLLYGQPGSVEDPTQEDLNIASALAWMGPQKAAAINPAGLPGRPLPPALQSLDLSSLAVSHGWGSILARMAVNTQLLRLHIPGLPSTCACHQPGSLQTIQERCQGLTALAVGSGWLPTSEPPNRLTTLRQLHVTRLLGSGDYARHVLHPDDEGHATHLSLSLAPSSGTWEGWRGLLARKLLLDTRFSSMRTIRELRLELRGITTLDGAARCKLLQAALEAPDLQVLDLTPWQDLTGDDLRQVGQAAAARMEAYKQHVMCCRHDKPRCEQPLSAHMQQMLWVSRPHVKVRVHGSCLCRSSNPDGWASLQAALQQLPDCMKVEVAWV